MIFLIKQLFERPYFPGDEEKFDTARILNTIGVYFFCALVVAVVALVPFITQHTAAALTIFFVLFLLYGITRSLLLRGRLNLALLFCAISLWATFLLLTIFSGGINSPIMLRIVPLALLSGSLLQPQIEYSLFILTVIFGLALSILQQIGFTLPLVFAFTPLTTWVLFALAGLLWVRISRHAISIRDQANARASQKDDARRQVETHLRENEERLRGFFQQSTDGIALVNEQGIVTVWNQSLEVITGLKNEHAIGRSMVEVQMEIMLPERRSPQVSERIRMALQEMLQSGQSPIFEKTTDASVYHPDGTRRFIQQNSFPIQTELGFQIGIITRDVTERRLAEEALRQSEEKFRGFVESSSEGFTLVDEQGEIIEWNPAREKITGLSVSQVMGQKIWDIQYQMIRPERQTSETYNRFKQGTVDALQTGQSPLFGRIHDINLTRPDASVLFMQQTMFPIKTDKGYRIGAVTRDVTENKLAEEKLRRSEAKFRAVVENSHDGIGFLDGNATVTYRSPSFNQITGYLDEERLGHSSFEAVHPDDMDEVRRYWTQVVQTPGTGCKAEYRIRHKNGTYLWMETTAKNLLNNPDIQQVVLISRDITEHKRADEQIRQSLVEKETLLRELYHRTKNNMSVMVALLELQADSLDDDRLRAAFSETVGRIRSMALVHQMLYESQNLSVINLKEYIDNLVGLLITNDSSLSGQIELTYDMDDILVTIDSAVPCGLILNELITNSLKHAFSKRPCGKIQVQAHENESGEITLVISDNGVGTPPGFDPRRDGGMGLQTVYLLAESQLRGTIQFHAEQGVTWLIQFIGRQYKARV